MAEDKVNTGPEEQVPGEGETTVTPPEAAGGGPPVQEDGEVVVNTDTIWLCLYAEFDYCNGKKRLDIWPTRP